MYVPAHFAETRLEVLHAALRAAGLFTLVTAGRGGLDASHLPMLLETPDGRPARLIGHVARANGQWRETPDRSPALAVALGPDAYVTPSWYPAKAESGRVVPTWNYVAVHAHGVVRFFHDRERLLDLVERLTDVHEQGRPHPWRVSDAPPGYVDGLLAGIVGVELEITRLEGKWKVSQNRSATDRRGVVEGLAADGHDDLARVMAALHRPE